ncbi:MAG: hypothetical protein QG618_2217 [Thermodesulfobacteriota bacterium]|nr:hypothetical protein [Thermodesulfobacteriota bacterium]
MIRKRIVFLSILVVMAMLSIAWTKAPSLATMKKIKKASDDANWQSVDLEDQIDQIRRITVEIERMVNDIGPHCNREKMRILDEKVLLFQELANKLDHKATVLKKTAGTLRQESLAAFNEAHGKKPGRRCAPGEIWIPGHKSPDGKSVPGHCAPQ